MIGKSHVDLTYNVNTEKFLQFKSKCEFLNLNKFMEFME